MTDILGLVGRLKKTADAARRTDGSDSPLSAEIRSAAAALEAMHARIEGLTSSEHGSSTAAASLSRNEIIEEWRAKYFEARDALFQFNYPPDPKLLREIADEIDCGNDCEHSNTEWDTNAHVCSRSQSKEGCAGEKASTLRQFADAIDVRSRLQPAAASEGPTSPEAVDTIRAKVIEECARALEGIAWSSPTATGEWALREAAKVGATAIRSLNHASSVEEESSEAIVRKMRDEWPDRQAVTPTHDVTRLREALETCRKRFAEYVDMHWAKGAHGKADRNREMVDLIDAALSDGVNKGGG